MTDVGLDKIQWDQQHCGVHQAPVAILLALMPDLRGLVSTFPANRNDYTWDVKVHMLMPRQYGCIPNWHVDNVPRVNGVQQFDQVRLDRDMWLWVSGPPLTQFRAGYVLPRTWHRFTQADEHRGVPAADFCWRGFVRATHRDIQAPRTPDQGYLRRHCQVYLDAAEYTW